MARLTTGQIVTSVTPTPLSTTIVSATTWVLRAPSGNASTVYFGPSGVSSATGFPLDPGDEMTFDRRPVAGALYDLSPQDVYVVGSGGVAAWLALQ